MSAVLEAKNLGKRFGAHWALRNCTFSLQAGQITALVGPNGSGKSTLLELAVGLLSPTEGSIEIFGSSPLKNPPDVLQRVGFTAQEHPLFGGFSVAEMLRFGKNLNPRWDDEFANARVAQLGLPLNKKIGKLSGGQRAQIALILSLAKRPDVVLLDEPVASFDPLARREFLQTLMVTAAETSASIVLSSHTLEDLERVCDSILVIADGTIQLIGEIESVLASHRYVVGPPEEEVLSSIVHTVISRSRTGRQVATLVNLEAPLVLGDSWSVYEPSLEDVILGYLERSRNNPIGITA